MSGRWRQSANPIRRKQEANRGWGRKRIEIRIVSQGRRRVVPSGTPVPARTTAAYHRIGAKRSFSSPDEVFHRTPRSEARIIPVFFEKCTFGFSRGRRSPLGMHFRGVPQWLASALARVAVDPARLLVARPITIAPCLRLRFSLWIPRPSFVRSPCIVTIPPVGRRPLCSSVISIPAPSPVPIFFRLCAMSCARLV
ncbi:hypothetical protein PCO31110_02850 [Pandoraea communis]|uniref:Uncharacterized protein n=1 Tax=Pandoraea communis TaxID=2508297 RepID=A0A5E4VTR1_9BURK|nr:hypothetical protein PCO31110_02850 [Pandoraea communis]